jgi:predicted phosphate transport protein (TIGR00153 family)
MAFTILKRGFDINKQIDEFLDKVSESGLIFQQGIHSYLQGKMGAFKNRIENIYELEHEGDALRRNLEKQLYIQTLIPESRGDVLELLESMDALLDRFKGALWRFDIECPEFFPEIHDDFEELTHCVVNAVEAIVLSSRAFFKNISAVNDHMHKVIHWESQSDIISTKLQRDIFSRKEMRLSHRMQLRDFVRHVDKIADRAEDVADKLGIYVIKRSL